MRKFLENLHMPSLDCRLVRGGYVLCGIVLCCILYLLICRNRRILIVKGEDGSVLLARSALREMIASIAGDIGISSKICTKIKCSHGQIFIDVMIRTGSWQNLSQVSSSLQKRLFDALVTHIGLAAIKKINVVVVGFRLPKRICAREQFQTDNDKVSGSCYFDGRQSEE